MYDIVIRGGTVIDGHRAPRRRGDVGIQGDRIAAVGDLAGAEAAQVIDAAGKIVAPGFVDLHNHSDGWFLRKQHQVSKTTQGFTTELIMADGISYAPVSSQTAHEWIYYMRGLNALRMEDYHRLGDTGRLHGPPRPPQRPERHHPDSIRQRANTHLRLGSHASGRLTVETDSDAGRAVHG